MEDPKQHTPQPQTIQYNQPFIGVNLPKIYANGFVIGMTLSDMNVTLMINAQPTHQILMSLISAKALMTGLKNTIDEFEKKTNTTIPEMNSLQEMLKTAKK